MIRYSVIVPLYNKGPYVEQTVRSVLRQTVSALEVLVVDDGSTDDGPARVLHLAAQDDRVRLLRQANAGVSRARNHGIEQARGEWVAFLDADDLWHPQVLEGHDHIRQRWPQAEFTGISYREIEEGQETFHLDPAPVASGSWPAPAPLQDMAGFMRAGLEFFTGSVAVAASLLNRTGIRFPVGESFGEDLDTWLRLAEHRDMVFMRVRLVEYLHVPGSLGVVNHKTLAMEAPFIERLRLRSLDPQVPERFRRSYTHYVRHCRVTRARQLHAAGRTREALQHLWSAGVPNADRRWWVTLALLLVPRELAGSFFQRRMRGTRRSEADPAGPVRSNG